MSLKQNILALLSGVAFCALIVGVYLTLATGNQPPSPGEVSKQRFARIQAQATGHSKVQIKARPVDPALRPSEVELERLLEQAVDPLQAFASGDVEWEETAFTLNDLFWLREERLQCAQDHALELGTTCRAEYTMLVRPGDTPGMGTIVDGEAQSGEFNERMTEVDRVACAAYVECLLNARIGTSIPVPSDQHEMIAIRQPTVYDWAPASLFEPDRVAELIQMYEDTMASAPEVMDAKQRWFYRMEQHQLDYLRYHLAMLDAQAVDE